VDSQSWSYLKSHELLDQQLASVRDADLANGLRTLANRALEFLLGEVGLANQSASLTDVHFVAVRDIE